MRARKSEPEQTDLRTLTLMLTVSIFIALLAFFIVLNCFSATSVVKSQQVTKAIHGAFGLGIGLSSEVTNDSGRANTGDIEEKVSTGLRAILPDVGFETSRTASGGSVMSLVVTQDDMETRWPALRGRLADVINRGGGKHMLLILAQDGAQHAAQLVPLARELAEDGRVNPRLVSVGYENRGRVAVEFRFVPTGGL